MAQRARVILTRAAPEAPRWIAQLASRGFEAQNLPLIEIGAAPDRSRLHAVWRELEGFDALMFVSANAVAQFFRERAPDVVPPWKCAGPGPRVWAPGPGTRQALLAAGVPAGAVDAPAPDAAQFDSEALWQQVAAQVRPGWRVLLVRGADAEGQGTGREWLSTQLLERGARLEAVSAYVRRMPAWDQAQRTLARAAAADGSWWVFSSSEAVANLRRLLPGQGWDRGRAIATHPRIAAALAGAGFGVVSPSRPAVDDIVAALESFE